MQVILWLLRSAVEAVIKLMAEKALELVIRQLIKAIKHARAKPR
ncbi:hypothetical protein [Sharpea azabuensis]|nr:hypothetical protein [Sharpea azabuensis]